MLFLFLAAFVLVTTACPQGTYTSNFLNKPGSTCISCPPNAVCDGTNVVCDFPREQDVTVAHGDVDNTPNVDFNMISCVIKTCPSFLICDGNSFKCPDGKYFDNKQCNNCPQNALCDGISICTTCTCPYQYINNGVCTNCPLNNECNGVTRVCKYGFTPNVNLGLPGDACTCAPNRYIKTTEFCEACPSNAQCNGFVFICNPTFTNTGTDCICQSNQFINAGVCTNCPTNGQCNGNTLKCINGYTSSGSTCKCTGYTDSSEPGICIPCPEFALCNGQGFRCIKGKKQTKRGCE